MMTLDRAVCYAMTMGYWGKFIGGMAGFAMGGPVGAVVGVALALIGRG